MHGMIQDLREEDNFAYVDGGMIATVRQIPLNYKCTFKQKLRKAAEEATNSGNYCHRRGICSRFPA